MPPERPAFRAAEFALLRAPLLPRVAAACTRVEVAMDDSAKAEDYLRTIARDPIVREAVAVSSPSLGRDLSTLAAGGAEESRVASRRAVLATTSYLLRMTTRGTPFGLLAGVAPVRFDASAQVRLGTAHRKAVRPDSAWLLSLVTRMEREPDLLRRLRVTANNIAVERNGRWTLAYLPRGENEGPGAGPGAAREVSVRAGAPVRQVMAACRTPRVVGDLMRELVGAFPGVATATVEGMIGGLVERGLLLTELRPSLAETDPLDHVIGVLLRVGAGERARPLERVRADLAGYAARPLGHGVGDLRAVVARMGELQVCDRPVQVDLRMDADVGLPHEVAREAERAAATLSRIAPATPFYPHLDAYCAEFTERYGLHQPVPLLEVLDPNIGLGPPAGYHEIRGHRRAPRLPDTHLGRERVLAELAMGALADGAREVVLDEAGLERLTPGEVGPPPRSVDLCLHLTADSQQALDQGNFTLVVPPAAVAPTAGAMLGRFAYLLDDPESVLAVSRAALERAGDAVPVQVWFSPRKDRSSNVARVPGCWPHRLSVGVYVDDDPCALDIRDVALVAESDRFVLVSTRTGQELLPHLPHMLNSELAPVAVRLMRELVLSPVRAWPAWAWGGMSAAPYLPRIRSGRTVLSPARWLLSDPFFTNRDLPDPQWYSQLDQWRRRWAVPDRVCLSRGDHRIELDLEAPVHRALLRREASRAAGGVVHETPEDAGSGAGWLSDGRAAYSSELVVPLYRTTGSDAAAPGGEKQSRGAAVPDAGRSGRAPGWAAAGVAARAQADRTADRWCYARLYASAPQHDELLAQHLPRLVAALPAGVDRWFFIRYLDPRPHLRLRFHTDDEVVARDLPGLLRTWVAELRVLRLADHHVLDHYQPEVARYGGPESLAAAERVFHQDSRVVLEQLCLRDRGALAVDPALLAAANYVQMARAVAADDPAGWLLAAYAKNPEHHAYFQNRRQAAVRLVDVAGDWAELRALPGGEAVVEAWQARAEALRAHCAAAGHNRFLADLLHMHHNRLLGFDRQSEHRSLAVARGVAQVHHDRERHLVRTGTTR